MDRQEAEKWGKLVMEQLAVDLQKDFPNTQGYSVRNLRDIK